MDLALIALAGLETLSRETMIFAAIGFLIGGIDDLAVDFVYLARAGWRRRADLALSPLPNETGVDARHARIAIFVPAWDEAAVIGAMLATTLDRYGAGDYRLYVGAYPNDRATIDRVAAIAEADTRVRLVIGAAAGPTVAGQKFAAKNSAGLDERAGR